MMTQYDQEAEAGHPLSRSWPQIVESEVEQNLVQFCFSQQAERHPASTEDVIDYMREAGKQIDRFWVNRFMERNAEKLALRQAAFLEGDRHNISPDEIKADFGCCKD
jgi:hypothetical protein